MHTLARTLFFGTLSALALALLGPAGPDARRADGAAPPAGRVVYLGRDLSDEQLITLGAAVAARGPDHLLLLDSPGCAKHTRRFLEAFRPDRVIPVGHYREDPAEVRRRLGVAVDPPVGWWAGPPVEMWRKLFPRARTVVVCPDRPRRRLLLAACLAGVANAPLVVVHDKPGEKRFVADQLKRWGTREAFWVGSAYDLAPAEGVRNVRLADEPALAAAFRRRLTAGGPVDVAVVANPEDTGKGMGGLSALAPWVAVQKRAPLLLTDPAGKDVPAVVAAALRKPSLRGLDTLLFLANLQAIPMLQRRNPIPGDKDPQIDLEPLTPDDSGPFSFAVGRLFHDDPAVVCLTLARQRLLARLGRAPRVLVASNPGGGLSLLETFSRNTAHELRNAGYPVTALFGRAVQGPDLRKEMARHDVVLWEGHHNTLIKEWDFPAWDEPLPPQLVFLQSCLALKDFKVHPAMARGAVAVVGTSTRTYSASGGATSLAFFDAVAYEGRSLGGALRQAKNFLQAYALLKEKRLGKQARRTGANVRAAWAFTLWGDPTLKLPPPAGAHAEPSLPGVRHHVVGNTLVVDLPGRAHPRVEVDRFSVRMPPNARLAGLVRRAGEGHPLVPLVFAEVRLPRARPGQTPRLHGRLPASRWVFNWDPRRRCGYLLALPRAGDTGQLRFHVQWSDAEVAERVPAGRGEPAP
jgi:hypothetical protein